MAIFETRFAEITTAFGSFPYIFCLLFCSCFDKCAAQAMCETLLRSQQSGRIGPIKMRLIQCTLDERAQDAYQQLEIVPRPAGPGPGEGPVGEEYETGGIPIMIK